MGFLEAAAPNAMITQNIIHILLELFLESANVIANRDPVRNAIGNVPGDDTRVRLAFYIATKFCSFINSDVVKVQICTPGKTSHAAYRISFREPLQPKCVAIKFLTRYGFLCQYASDEELCYKPVRRIDSFLSRRTDRARSKANAGCAVIPAGPVLAALLSLPSCWADRNDVRLPDHLVRVAYAVAAEARDIDEAAALETIAYHESGNCLRVQERYTHSGAYSAWQLEGKRHLYKQPFIGLEIEPIQNAVYAASDVWRHSHNCGGSFRDMMTSYAGRPCGKKWPTLDARVNTYWYLRNRMQKEMKKYGN